MATLEHCLYCFEALASSLEKRPGLSLKEIQRSWPEYAKTLTPGLGDGGKDTKKLLPALQRLSEQQTANDSASSASSRSSLSLAADTPETSVDSPADDGEAITESPLFVTWNTVSPRSGHRSLRGCIGTFEPQDLEDGLSSYSLTSALHDMRFDPVTASELPSLEVAVTLLTDFESADDEMDWTLGVHGLRISFFYHGRRLGATYLPDVAVEQEWTKEETLVSLMRKAGWTGRKDKWRDIELKVVRYQGKKESLEYGEYKKWRDWIEKNKAKSG
ncbi:AMMECR1-like protein [Colletotrichum orbiculare MAFF 240422]|uniref:AMMECR1-like protein n=3 Tax=Colletotrichum orbiculare species complex TaxID=2707354 RepID=N4VCM1_COLOR|nr:AMMECR1-like protein [Colletotrichum orbiculare MAFF 240422]TDZ36872.1 AMMECR1-like protein [Colletotrichum spinosum]TDZ48223.1 AMMECR1-like protein [Colletotrichum trifolii]